MARILFILKARDVPYGDYSWEGPTDTPAVTGEPVKYLSSGLFNSASFVQDMLSTRLGHTTALVHVLDNNGIDREVTAFRPDIVVIEAFWVVPEKFAILHQLHPHVTWIVRNHSAVPFLANEGVGMDWSLRYMDYPKLVVACNDSRTDREFHRIIGCYKPDWDITTLNRHVAYLPNYYPPSFTRRDPIPASETLNIACFGALRPLKNHLMQALAAIEYADTHGKHLRFHINGTRVEMNGLPVVHNLRKMFSLLSHELVEHTWAPHDAFVALCRQMDVGMQVSYTETFNIVTADMVMNDVPVVTSRDIRWVDPIVQADPNDSLSIVNALGRALDAHTSARNVAGLHSYDEASVARWQEVIDDLVERPLPV